MQRQPKIYLVEDDEATRQLIEGAVRDANLEIASFAKPEDLLESCQPSQHGCQVLDMFLPGMNGLELRTELYRKGCRQPFIAITGAGDVRMAVETMRGGAVDFLEKPFSMCRLLAAIREAIQRDGAHRDTRLRFEAVRSLLETLTPRERQVMDMVVAGQLTKQIASQLGISVKTVDVHRSNVIHKMGVKSTAQLVRLVTTWRSLKDSESPLAAAAAN